MHTARRRRTVRSDSLRSIQSSSSSNRRGSDRATSSVKTTRASGSCHDARCLAQHRRERLRGDKLVPLDERDHVDITRGPRDEPQHQQRGTANHRFDGDCGQTNPPSNPGWLSYRDLLKEVPRSHRLQRGNGVTYRGPASTSAPRPALRPLVSRAVPAPRGGPAARRPAPRAAGAGSAARAESGC